jgi:hypothetical protein
MTLILYGTETPTANLDYQSIVSPMGQRYFIRVEESNAGACEALENASPVKGETVLNTVDLVQ